MASDATGELTRLPALELARLIQDRSVSSLQVVQAHLARIEAANPQLNALVQVAAASALARAQAADEALARGETWGRLHGLPFTAKDILDTAGVVTAAGLEERRGFVPQQDAVVVARMKAAGAILLGKTNVPPGGGGGHTDNPVYGRTLNPYHLARSPGGSSGGEAAAIAACLSPLGLGSDSGGSLRLPAHYCGVATLKPTSGRVPSTGAYALPGGLSDPRSQIGPMARCVTDLWPAFLAMAGPDWEDSAVAPMPLADPGLVPAGGLRVAYYTDDGQARPTPGTETTLRAAASALSAAGLVVDEARPACIADSREITERYWHASAMAGGADYEQLLSDWDGFRSAMLAFLRDFDLLLTPADAAPAQPLGTEDPLLFNYTLPFSLTGWPCVVVRAGTSPEGLPIGVQVVAGPWREDIALAVAGQIEALLGGWQPPRPLFMQAKDGSI